jgi:Na+-translocating ferredoxin:NAD+ oxidoreductase RnfD subunit
MSFAKVFAVLFTGGMILVLVMTIATEIPVAHLVGLGVVAWLASKIGS